MALPSDIITRISRRLVDHAGLELPPWIIEARASARMATLQLAPDAYIALINTSRGASELSELVEAVRVGESSLFRHKQQIAALVADVAPAIAARGHRAIRVWSAGCAAGEEPYTLAAVLTRALPDWPLQILATDVSTEALAAARAASYPVAELEDVPAEYRDAFLVDGDRVRVHPNIARLVKFEIANLLDAPRAKNFDLVWCRNVLIYFSADARRRAVERLIGATQPDGFVFVGYSESLRDFPDLEARTTGEATYYIRTGGAVRATPQMGMPDVLSRIAASVPSPPSFPKASKHKLVSPEIAATQRPGESLLALLGAPTVADVTTKIGEHLSIEGLKKLTIDLDGASLLDDELAPVFRRAQAVSRGAGLELELRTTRVGTKRWLSRHGLMEEPTP
ncbi:MAG: CheR family methyltransferase [Kofleriaceae bacterium]|nr:CheR family methyltransferase [Kofleriaceae bacterium]